MGTVFQLGQRLFQCLFFDQLGAVAQWANLFQFPDAWAAILVASIIGIAFYALVLLAERLLMPWHVSFRAADER